MTTYAAPTDEYLFQLHEVLRIHERSDLPGFAELTPELTRGILQAAGRFHENVLHPINLAADQEGAHFVDGKVSTPRAFRPAWDAYRKAGWHRMTLSASIGGEGLPPVLGVPLSEIGDATAHSLRMYGGFCAPVAHMLDQLGADWMRSIVVPRLVAGDWTATMCLTEAHCGSDLRQLRTRATQRPDGSWRVTGSKIFISGADHDLTDNIVHVVLAKVPDADGRVSASLADVHVFLVSKHQLDVATGRLNEPNAVRVSSIEHKMGIAASATCELDFQDAVAWRIAPGTASGSAANMAPMFLLMNHARFGVAMSGVAYADISWQNASAYARERLAGRAPGEPRNPGGPADPIIVHPDIRRLLLESRSFAQGARALALRIALQQSIAEFSPDAEERVRASDLVELMTPVMKAYFTDRGFEATNACLQVLGGHGYIRDYGLEQYVRNARIGQLYEGANGVQAMDLIGRKMRAHKGRSVRTFFGAVEGFTKRHSHIPHLCCITRALEEGMRQLREAIHWLEESGERDCNAPGSVAYDVLTMFGILAVGWAWGETAAASVGGARPVLARIWMEREMALLRALASRIRAGSAALMVLADAEV